MSTAELPTDAPTKLVTAEELLRDYHDQHCELIEGRVVSMSPTFIEHGDISNEIAYLLNVAVRKSQHGKLLIAEAGFLVSRKPDTVRVPDVAFVTHERLAEAAVTKGFFPGAPDLAVEVVSPSDTAPRVHEKARMWIEAGCRAVWLVWPDDRSVTVYRSLDDVRILTGDAILDGGDVVPGFSHPIAQFFGDAV